MKKLMPIIAASAILLGSACDTYTSTTDPATYASGWGIETNEKATGHTSSHAVAEANNNATFDNKTITSEIDSVETTQPASGTAVQGEEAAVQGRTPVPTGGQ